MANIDERAEIDNSCWRSLLCCLSPPTADDGCDVTDGCTGAGAGYVDPSVGNLHGASGRQGVREDINGFSSSSGMLDGFQMSDKTLQKYLDIGRRIQDDVVADINDVTYNDVLNDCQPDTAAHRVLDFNRRLLEKSAVDDTLFKAVIDDHTKYIDEGKDVVQKRHMEDVNRAAACGADGKVKEAKTCPVILIGYPHGRQCYVTIGWLKTIKEDGFWGSGTAVQYDVSSCPGNSGCVVLPVGRYDRDARYIVCHPHSGASRLDGQTVGESAGHEWTAG